MRRAGLLALGLMLLGAAPAPAAVSRTEANAIAKRVVRSERTNASRLYTLRNRVPRGAVVTEGGISNRLAKRARRRGDTMRVRLAARPLRRPAWMFWLDQAPGAGFQHPGMIVLVDAVTGRVRRQSISWWPVVDGRRILPPGVRRPPRAAASRPPPPAWSAAVVPGLRNDCIVTIGDRQDPHFVKAMAAVTQMGNRVGVPVAAARTVSELGPKIDELARRNPPCTDVMIYVAGHGWAPPGSDVKMPNGQAVGTSAQPRVTIRSTVAGGANPVVVQEHLELEDLRRVMRARPHLTFKLAVESCFSGRWTLAMAAPNLRITLTSSRAGEVTFLAVTHAQAGRQSGGKMQWDENAPVGTPDGPDDPPPFTKGLTEAIERWSESPEERARGEDLGLALGYAGTHREGDRARTLGWQSGQTDDRTRERPHAGVPPPSQQPIYDVVVTGSYRHIGPGASEVCWDIRTDPPRADAQLTVRTTGPGVAGGAEQSARTDANGFVRVRVPIDAYGEYRSEVEAQGGRPGAGSVLVSEAQGTCPPP
jgi:hypothetical protein